MNPRTRTLGAAALALALAAGAGCGESGSNGKAPRPEPAAKAGPGPGPTGQADPASAVDPRLPPLRIAFIPQENPDKLISNARPALAALEERLGRKTKAWVTTTYAMAVEALRQDRADVSFMSPLPYVLARAQTGAEAVLGEIYAGKPWYVAKIFVRKDSGIKKLEDLRGKTIAFVDPISSSGYMYPRDVFARAGLLADATPGGGFFKRVYFAGGDQQAIVAVHTQHVDAAGIGEFASNLLGLEERDAVTAIAESARIPSHCVVVRKGLDPALREKFVQAMLELSKPENKHLLAPLYGTDGYVKVTHETYAEVEAMAKKHGFLK